MIPAVSAPAENTSASVLPADLSIASPEPVLKERAAKVSLLPPAPSSAAPIPAPTESLSKEDVPPVPAQILNLEPKLDAEGAYIGEATSPNGEKFFVKMEKLDAHSAARWRQYRTWTNAIASDRSSVLKAFALHMKVELKNDRFEVLNENRTKLTPEEWDALIGMTDSEFEEFSTKFQRFLIGEQSLQELQDKSLRHAKKWEALGAVDVGTAGMRPLDGSYIVYATKNPDFSVAKLPLLAGGGRLSLKAYLDRYDDLIMSVGSSFSENDFENRGIFRNPCSTIAGNYKRISMTLHAFSAAVARKFFPSLEALRVQPVGSMLREIAGSLRPDEFTINGEVCKITNPHEIPFDQPDWNCYVRMPVEKLDRYYRQHPQRQNERQML